MKKLPNKTDFKALYNSTIFSKIYKTNGWGGKKGEYFSGTGSHNPFVKGYADVIADFILQNEIKSIVEIGCGDFTVSNNILNTLQKNEVDFTYIGYDVVRSLINQNNANYSTDKINFQCKDSCVGNIKSGELLIIRQVLQHLNNRSIKQVVDKFKNYKYIIVTEHQASEKYSDIIPNKDQETGVSIRLRYKSAVYLEKEPFKCKINSKLYSIPQSIYGIEAFINTYVIIN